MGLPQITRSFGELLNTNSLGAKRKDDQKYIIQDKISGNAGISLGDDRDDPFIQLLQNEDEKLSQC